LLTQMVLTLGRHDSKLGRSLYRTAYDWARSEFCHFLARRGVEPQSFFKMVRFRRRAGWLAPLQDSRGLPTRDKVGG
jgi:hypothetical protein